MAADEQIRPYEVIVILHPDATEAEQKSLFAKNKSILEGFAGRFNHLDTWGKRNLANPIGKNKRGIYFHGTFAAKPEAVAELERTMKINDRVLRFTHTRLEDDTNLTKYLEAYRQVLADTAHREREREAKIAAKKAAASRSRDDQM